MLSGITPLGERGRQTRWWLTVTAYAIGSLAAAVVLGLLAGELGRGIFAVAGSPDRRLQLVVVASLCVVSLAFDLKLGGIRLPTIRRQVNEAWLTRYRGWVYGVTFGFQLGLGVVTIVTTSLVYATLAVAILTGSVQAAVAIGLAFSMSRAAVILSVVRVRDTDRLVRMHVAVQRLERVAAQFAVGTAGVAALAALSLSAAVH
jgi:sulfite exporter TauE/SafE